MRLSAFQPPRSPAAVAALELATRYHTESVRNHVIRSWLWAEAFAVVEDRRDIDHELLYVSALLHDIGMAPAFDNVALSYEEAGGHVAVALTTGAGWQAERSRRALEVIVRHNWPAVDATLDVEGYLLEVSTALDISGARPEALPKDLVQEVLAEFPRLQLAQEFGRDVVDQADRKPHTAARRLVDGGVVAKLQSNPLEQSN